MIDGPSDSGGVHMNADTAFQGKLFPNDFLRESVAASANWWNLDDSLLEDLKDAMHTTFARFPISGSPNETHIEDDAI